MEDFCTSQMQTLGNINQRNKHTFVEQSGFFTWRVTYLFIKNSPLGGILDGCVLFFFKQYYQAEIS